MQPENKILTPEEVKKNKQESFDAFFQKYKPRFEMFKKNFPEGTKDSQITYPLLYDPQKNEWYWLNRQQWKRHRASQGK